MLRIATSSIAKRAIIANGRSTTKGLPAALSFHSSAKSFKATKEEETTSTPATSGGGISPWYVAPIGLAAAVPFFQYEWILVNEETQLAACFIAFCVIMYKQGGDAIYKFMDEGAQTMLKEHREAEEKVLEALREKLAFLRANNHMVKDFEAIEVLRGQTYQHLNAAGKIKPLHDFKAQMERTLSMIAAEEQSVEEKAKSALMQEATTYVQQAFAESKPLQKAALDAAIAKIKGTNAGKENPVQATFVKFFQEKAAEAAKVDDASEAMEQRATLIGKLNAVAKNEGFFFQFDTATGNVKMVV